MKLLLSPFFLLVLAGSCRTADTTSVSVSPWGGTIQQWGTLREALRDGQDQGRVTLSDVSGAGVYGVGALEGLAGEITIADGEVWVSEGHAEHAVTTRGETSDAQATVLFLATVSEWRETVVAEAVDPSELDAFLAREARAGGLDPTQPFPFVIEGDLRHLNLHVIAGECPVRARMLGREASAPPYRFHSDTLDGRLVGIFAPDSSGILCHAGARSHVHALLEADGGLTGHVESVGLAAGARLRVPQP